MRFLSVMMNSFQIKNPLYPVFTISAALLIFINALILARSIFGVFFLIAIYFLLCAFGYAKTCLKLIPFLAIYLVIFSIIFYFASNRNLTFTYQMAVRLSGVVIAFIPGISMPPSALVRCLTQLKFPRLLSLGILITLTFIPILNREINQIRNAMKTRGATSLWRPQVFYRAILIPLIVRLVNISDTLTLSVETRGFICDNIKPSVYKPIKIKTRDIIFTVLFLMIFVICLSLNLVIKK